MRLLKAYLLLMLAFACVICHAQNEEKIQQDTLLIRAYFMGSHTPLVLERGIARSFWDRKDSNPDWQPTIKAAEDGSLMITLFDIKRIPKVFLHVYCHGDISILPIRLIHNISPAGGDRPHLFIKEVPTNQLTLLPIHKPSGETAWEYYHPRIEAFLLANPKLCLTLKRELPDTLPTNPMEMELLPVETDRLWDLLSQNPKISHRVFRVDTESGMPEVTDVPYGLRVGESFFHITSFEDQVFPAK